MAAIAGQTSSTERFYYRDTYQNELTATIQSKGEDKHGTYFVLDRTIFHPQGGGQPDDKGTIEIQKERFSILKLSAPREPTADPYVVKHYIDPASGDTSVVKPGDQAVERIDIDTRTEYARWHSAGHLLANVIEEIYPELQGVQGNHFPGQGFVKFIGGRPNKNDLKQQAADKLATYIEAALPVINEWRSSKVRTVQFKGLKAYPCGGTHVQNSREIGAITIRGVKNDKVGRDKKPGLRISYKID